MDYHIGHALTALDNWPYMVYNLSVDKAIKANSEG